MVKNTYFSLASDSNGGKPGIRPNTNKMQRFNVVVPLFKAHKIWFPEEMREDPIIVEATTELSLASPGGFKSKHDDFVDTISMLASLQTWRPSEETPILEDTAMDIWEDETLEESTDLSSYIV